MATLANPHTADVPETAINRIARHARALSGQMKALNASLFPPTARKTLRSFTSGEAARFIGVSDGYLRQLSLDGLGPVPALSTGGRRSYTPEQIGELRTYLASARPKEALSFLPARQPGDKLQVMAVANFKGGSAKTTTSLYLTQFLALEGYRVLAIDLDPLPAEQNQILSAGKKGGNLVIRQRFPVEHDVHAEVEHRVEPDR